MKHDVMAKELLIHQAGIIRHEAPRDKKRLVAHQTVSTFLTLISSSLQSDVKLNGNQQFFLIGMIDEMLRNPENTRFAYVALITNYIQGCRKENQRHH